MIDFIKWLAQPVTIWLETRRETKAAEHKRDLSIINNQARLAQSTEDNNHAWEMASLTDKDKFLRLFSFWMFTAPILITVISPEHGAEIFENLKLVPPWLVQTWVALNGGIWGLASLKNIVPQIVGSLKKQSATAVK